MLKNIFATKATSGGGGESRAKHYVFSGRVRTRDAGSERVDWQFVGFPSSSSSSASAASVVNEPSFTLESATRRRVNEGREVHEEGRFVRGHYKRSSLHEQQFNYDEPYGLLRRANSVEPPPPPVPPRGSDGTGPRRPPPPRPLR